MMRVVTVSAYYLIAAEKSRFALFPGWYTMGSFTPVSIAFLMALTTEFNGF